MKGVLISLIIIIIIVSDLVILFYNPGIVGQVTSELNTREEKIVTKIIDGDTIIIEGGEHVRLLGMDCDEKGKKCYTKAKDEIEKLLLGKEVILEREGDDLDKYGRKLRYIFLDGENVNEKMVSNGFCVARFDQNSKYQTKIIEAEQEAIQNSIGCKWN